jgi:thiamine-phosphate diphosphorylase
VTLPLRSSLPLARLLLVTDGSATGGRPLVGVVAAAVDGGVRAVLLRERHLPPSTRAALATALRELLGGVGGLLIVASDAGILADGVHLASGGPMPAGWGRPAGQPAPAGWGRPVLVGRSCHSAAEVARAAEEGCDYATLSPIFPSASKPGYGPPLGVASLRGHPIPVWALGGVDAANAASCVEAGAAGVAVMGAFMRAADPAVLAQRLCGMLGEGPA